MNCINKTDFPLQEKCLIENTLYQLKTLKRKYITTFEKQKLKQDMQTIKTFWTTKSTHTNSKLSNKFWKIKVL